MYLSYNSTKIIPAPYCKFTTEVTRSAEGVKLGKQLVLTLTGTFVYGKGGATYQGSGYPADDYTKCPLEDLLTKQQDLRGLFADDYQWLEIQPDPEISAPSFKWVAKLRSIDFEESRLNPRSDYTIVLELQNTTWDGIEGIEESWDLSEQDSPRDTYSLTHKLSCTSREEWDTLASNSIAGWKKSLAYITGTMGGLGIDGGIIYNDPGMDLSLSFDDYNYRISKVIDEAGGRFDITETWVMSEDPYWEEQSVTVDYDRDNPEDRKWIATVEGSINGFDDQWSAVSSRWGSVSADLYSNASSAINSIVSGVALRSSAKTKHVVRDELNFTISYSYSYDEGSTNCDQDITTTVSINDPECDVWTVIVDGTIKGIADDTNNAYTNALSCYGSLSIDSLASSAYSASGGSRSLRGPTQRTIRHSEYQGTVGFSATYHDRATPFKHDKTITTNYGRSEDVTTVTVDGNIVGDCTALWSDITTELATVTMASTYSDATAVTAETLCEYAESFGTTRNEVNLTASYNYTFSSDLKCTANVETNVTVKNDPSACGYDLISVDGTITGRRTSGAAPWDNALSEYLSNHSESASKARAAGYTSGDLFTQLRSVSYAEERFTISYNYEFTNQGAYTIDETITESWGGGEECGITKITQEGTVTGLCTGVAGTAYENAVNGYSTVLDPDGVVNKIRNSESHNENRGTISYVREFDDRAYPFILDYTETTRETLNDCYKTCIIEGQVEGVCTNNSAGSKISNAETGYAYVAGLTPSEYVPTGWQLTSSSKGSNSYAGRVTFSREFREKSRCIVGAISESVEVTDDLETDVFAVVNVLGGSSVIQDKGGTTPFKRAINIQVQFPPTCTDCSADIGGGPDVEGLVGDAEPTGTVVVVTILVLERLHV